MLLLCCGCSGRQINAPADVYSQEKQQLLNEFIDSVKTDNLSSNSSSSINFSCDIALPEGFIKVEKGTDIYIYNKTGSSIIISEISTVNNFYGLDKTDAYQIIGSNNSETVIDEFYRKTVFGYDSVVIEFSDVKNGEKYYCVYYLIKYENFYVSAVIQSPEHDLCNELNDIFGDAVIKIK